MKTMKIVLVAALAAVLASCGGGKSGGKPNFGDNEYAVRTVQGQNAELQTTYPATIKGIQDVEIRPKISGFITKLCVKERPAGQGRPASFRHRQCDLRCSSASGRGCCQCCKGSAQHCSPHLQ